MSFPEVTFREFSTLMEKRRRTVDDLVDLFRGKIEDPREFFERVMSCHWRNPKTGRYEDRSDVAIPYRSVIEFYRQELHYFKDTNTGQRTCACGCRQPVFDRKKWASAACRKRSQRQRSESVDYRLVSA